MLKKEQIWREILQAAFGAGVFNFTQKDLASRLGVSLSTVNHALSLPRSVGAVKVAGRGFGVTDKEKFLLLWASHRRMRRDIVYAAFAAGSAMAREGMMPPQVIYGAYSGYRKKYGTAPADYDVVYVYAEAAGLAEVKKRFPPQVGAPNLFVLRADDRLATFGDVTPPVQLFADLWNLPEWYAADFLRELKAKFKI